MPGDELNSAEAAAAPDAMVLTLSGLGLRIGEADILHDVRMELRAGEIYGLLGPNGAGKSTTIAACLGLLPYRSGTIRVFGVDPASHRREIHARVGVLPERLGFYDWMTAAEYLTFFARLHGRNGDADDVHDRLAAVGLERDSRRTIGAYSHGMRQRLGLARALVADPELLILDEPTSGLDPGGRREIHDILWQLSHERGVAVLLCTHLLDDVERLCTRIGILSAGRTMAEGRLPDLLGDGGPRRYWLRLGGVAPSGTTPVGCVRCMSMGERTLVELAPGAVPSAVWRDMLVGGWPITEITLQHADVETLYFILTQASREEGIA